MVDACSGFMAIKEEVVLVGHNKDWWSPDTTIHVYPAEEGSYARLFIEIPYPHIFNSDYMVLAGGINEQGLCYESFVTPFKLASFEWFKPLLFKYPVDHILQKYSTVDEVVDFIESHNLFFLNYILCSGQLFVVDKTGDAAIIEGDDIIRLSDDYMVCTNFLHSSPNLGGYPCWRYDTAVSLLQSMTALSVSYFNEILNTIHQEYYTQYSWIYEMNGGVLHLYHYYDYSNEIILDLKEEFQMSAHSYYLPSLFEPADNQAPEKPQMPQGPATGKRETPYWFDTNTTDSDNHPFELYYTWDWGDGTQTYWLLNRPPYWGAAQNSWKKKGVYEVKVKARDIYGKESPWSDSLQIHITS